MEKKELKDLSKNYLRPGRRFARLFQMKLIGMDPGFLFYDPETQQSLDLPAWFVRRACNFLVGVKAPPPYKKTVPKSPESLSLCIWVWLLVLQVSKRSPIKRPMFKIFY
jgi:hypothetical protein